MCSECTSCWIRRQGHASYVVRSTMDMVMEDANTAADRSGLLPATTLPKEAPDVEVVVHSYHNLLGTQEFAQRVQLPACRAAKPDSAH